VKYSYDKHVAVNHVTLFSNVDNTRTVMPLISRSKESRPLFLATGGSSHYLLAKATDD
jgi:hypothetical protein